MTQAASYYEQSLEDWDWLNAMSKNKTFFDPRTRDVYEDIAPINPYALAALPSTNQRAFVSKWAQNTSIAQECLPSPISMSEASIISNDDIKDNQKVDVDVTSVSSSTVCTSVDKDFLASFQIEAIPPYPKRNPTNDLFNLRNQICRPGTSTQVLYQTSCPTFADDDYMYSPYLEIEVPSMTMSSTKTTSSSSTSTEEMNIGKLIAGKVRQVAAHSVAACEKLKRNFRS